MTQEQFAAIPRAPDPDWYEIAANLPYLAFEVDVSIFGRQASLTVSVQREGARVLLSSSTRTHGLLRLFYRVDLDGTSQVLAASAAVEKHDFSGRIGRRDIAMSRHFDYEAGLVRSETRVPNPLYREVPLEDDCRLDLLAALLAATRLPADQGGQWRLPVFHEDRIHTLLVNLLGVERLDGPEGPSDALRYAASMPVRPSSFFRRGGRMTLWVGADGRRLPLRLRLETAQGSATAELRQAAPPSTETLAQTLRPEPIADP